MYKSDFVKFTDYKIYDLISSDVFLAKHQLEHSHAVVVDIDERSINAFGQ
ncbi:MAG: hypothetical protein FAF04_06275 [Epsilonproteobacteria bacterium]|nr:hypothetical protein [Campylobacterota bacterium]